MARRGSQLKLGAFAALLGLLTLDASAQGPATPVALGTPPVKKKPAGAPTAAAAATKAATMGSPGPELENVRKALEALTPEQRAQFRENFIKWMNMSVDDKKALRDAQELRRKHMTEEIDDAVAKTGLQLDPARRQAFNKRYSEERRKIEETLHKETEEKRGPRLEELRNRLKAEFSTPPTAPAGQ